MYNVGNFLERSAWITVKVEHGVDIYSRSTKNFIESRKPSLRDVPSRKLDSPLEVVVMFGSIFGSFGRS